MADAAAVVGVLRAARERLSEPGVWVQGTEGIGDDHDCLYTALMTVRPSRSRSASHKAVELLKRHGDALWCVPTWNDAPGRTLDEVLAVLDRAIAQVEQEAGR